MNAATIVQAIVSVLQTVIALGPTVLKLEQDIQPFAEEIYNTLVKKDTVTTDDLTALETAIDSLANQLQQPLPEE